MNNAKQFEVIIIGGSYAGLAAGMALGRALRNVLIIDSGNPCNRQTPHSHNFLTNDGKTPKEIATLARQQVGMYGTVSFLNGWLTAAAATENGFSIQTESGEEFAARKIIFATGVKDILPRIPGFTECWGISVIHCPYCHGYEVRHQKTGILANGDAGFEFAALIFNWTKSLTIYTNSTSTFSEKQVATFEKHGIRIVETGIERLEHHHGDLTNIIFTNGEKDSVKALYARLPFTQHSTVPESLGCSLTHEGYIKVDDQHRTTIPGVFACGDNVTRMRTVANAVSMGTITGMMVNKELIEEYF